MPSIVRALDYPNYVYYGAFDPVSPTKYPGWIMDVRSKLSKHVWTIAVIMDTSKLKPFFRLLERIPFENYVGGESKMYEGDAPVLCREERKKCLNA